MMGAPSEIAEKQMRELGIELRKKGKKWFGVIFYPHPHPGLDKPNLDNSAYRF
jgi:hypothetical protein